MTKEPLFRSFVPLEPDDETSRNMGEFMFYWGLLEHKLDTSIPVIFRVNPTLSWCITANLGTKAKIDMIRSAVDMLSDALENETVESADELLSLASEYSGRFRNAIAHGQPIVLEDGEDTGWHWVRFSARKKLDVTVHGSDADRWRVGTVIVSSIAQWWHETVSDIHAQLSKLSDEQIDDLCAVYFRDAEEGRQHPHTPPPESPDNS